MKLIVFLLGSLYCFSSVFGMEVFKHKITFEELADYNFCHANRYPSKYCQKALDKWLDKHPNDIIKAAKMTRVKMNAWVAVPLFYRGAKHKDFKCSDEDLILSLVDAYKLPPHNTSLIKQAEKITLNICPEEAAGRVAQSLSFKQKNFKQICKGFKKLNLLKGIKKVKCK